MESEEKRRITLRWVKAVAATRALGGIGLGLLLADRMDRDSRRAVGRRCCCRHRSTAPRFAVSSPDTTPCSPGRSAHRNRR
jgi:hypothetical protein